MMTQAGTMRPKRISDHVLQVLILLYNTFILAFLVFCSPLLLAIVAGTAKRRETFGPRMGWHRYAWQGGMPRQNVPRIWVHALSVGEVQAAQPLIKRLMVSHHDAELFFTTSTYTGFQTAGRLFNGSSVHLGYFPYDWIGAVRRVTDMIDPSHVILTETDIWPTFLWEMNRRKIPVSLVNLRISDHTWRRYLKFRWFSGKVFESFTCVCVQTITEMDRLVALGADRHRVCVTGNLKFDAFTRSADAQSVLSWHDRFKISRAQKIIVAGSTHEGEEAILSNVFESILSEYGDVSFIVAPRDPDRSSSVKTCFRQKGIKCAFLSELKKGEDGRWPQVTIVDTIGELKAIYRIGYAAIVGGSLVPFGGHNPLEPAFWGKPVLFGPDMRDFAVIAETLTTGGGAVCVENAAHLESVLIRLLENPSMAAHMGATALGIMKAHQGAVDRTLVFLRLMNSGANVRHRKGTHNRC